MTTRAVYAGIELGGTKVVCGLADDDGCVLERAEIPTRDPDSTMAAIRKTLEAQLANRPNLAALGVATFGPVRLDERAKDFGVIGPTPKTLWQGYDLLGFFRAWLDVPIAIDTDVNSAAFGEACWGAAVGCKSVVYITVGTGIGGGILINGIPIHGLLHPEVGHMRVPRADSDTLPGLCPSHGDCVEGLAAGPAIIERWGRQLNEIDVSDAAFRMEAHYLAHLVTNLMLTLVPERVILGGGVMKNAALFPLIRTHVQKLLNGFIPVPEIEKKIEQLIVPPGLGTDAGLLGAAALAICTV